MISPKALPAIMNTLLRLVLFVCLVFAGQSYATTAVTYGYEVNAVQSGVENLNNNGHINPSGCYSNSSSRDSQDRARAGSFFVSFDDFVVPNKGVADLLADPKFQRSLRDVDCVDCDDIARQLYKASGEQGKILDLTVPGGSIKVKEFGKLEDFVDHRVFSDGKNIIDPRFSNSPIPIKQYMDELRKLNPGLEIKDVTP